MKIAYHFNNFTWIYTLLHRAERQSLHDDDFIDDFHNYYFPHSVMSSNKSFSRYYLQINGVE